MRVLVACEFSGRVRDAFLKRGHEAMSCDLLPSDAPGPHYQGDVFYVIDDGWDLMIAHPPCTYLCVPGAHYLHKQQDRWLKMLDAKFFFEKLLNSDIPKKAIENPVPHKYAKLPKYSQIIQPWMFGHELSKRTCLWLIGLPNLIPTDIQSNRGEGYIRSYSQQKLGHGGKSANSKWYACANWKKRSTTFQGIANAMAEQWG